MKPHLRLHITKHQKAWWIGLSYPWDKGYTLASTMNYMDPLQAIIAAGPMCRRAAEMFLIRGARRDSV